MLFRSWMLCDAGDVEGGVELLQRAIRRGYFVVPTLSGSAQFDRVRQQPAFLAVLSEAEAGRQHALDAFREAGGERLLGTRLAPG